jgi:hypothetical protein
MALKLSQEEKETIITFNEAELMVNILTYNRQWQLRMKEMGIKPIQVEGQAKEYEFPKKWLRLPVKPKPPTKRQQEARQVSIRKAQQVHRIKK